MVDFLRKNRRPIIGLALISLGLPLVYYLFAAPQMLPSKTTSLQHTARYPGPQQKIQGFQFDSHLNGTKQLSLKASRVSFHKKKIGFFRFGLINEVRIENAVFTFFGLSDNEHATFDIDVFESAVRDILSKEPKRRIASLVIEPIVVEIRDPNHSQLLSTLHAGRAVLELQHRTFSFQEGVVLKSGNRILETEILDLVPADGDLVTRGSGAIKSADRHCRANPLRTDFFLQSGCFHSN